MDTDQVKTLVENSGDLRETFLGYHESSLGVQESIGIRDEHRNTHVLELGATGTGKTQAAVHTALQDIHKDRGICFINPKGDAINQILAKIPDDRLDDVIYINPASEPVTPINPLEAHVHDEMSPAELENQKEIIVGDILALFKRQSVNWGDQWPRILSTVLRAFLDLNIRYEQTNTLADALHAVTDDDALTDLIDRTDDPVLRSHLVSIQNDLSDHAKLPLQNRIQDFLGNDVIRRVLNGENSVDFYDAITSQKIILVDVQRGEIGRNASPLVGSIVLSQVWAAAQARIALPEEERQLFSVFVDEVKHYASESSNFDEILAESREYGLSVWLISQYLDQLDPAMQRAAVNNCRTKIVFRPEIADDGTRVANMLVGLDKDDLQRLGEYRAAMQRPDGKNAVTFTTFPPWDGERDQDELAQLKRQATYGSEETELQATDLFDLGPAANAGDQLHSMLLQAAQTYLENRPEVAKVNLLHQDPGDERADGHVMKQNGAVAHLEAEVSSLTKPAKVLQNLRRAAEQGRKCVFIVEEDGIDRLLNIVEEPVNRRGSEFEDEQGSYRYYKDDGGEPVTDLDLLRDAEYRVLVRGETGAVRDVSTEAEVDCPELDTMTTEEELESFCLYREENGFCTQLEQPCVLVDG